MILKVLPALFLLVKGTSGFSVEVTDYYCQQRAIKAEFTEFCNENNTCAFGEEALISGYLNLTYAVSNSWGLSDESYVYMDTNLHVSALNQKIQNMEPVLLCNENYILSDDNNNNACPGTGVFAFEDLPLQMPNITRTNLFNWAATGWTGSVTVDMYTDEYGNDLIGRCILDIVTHSDNMSNRTSENFFMDNLPDFPKTTSQIAMYIVGGLAVVAFIFVLVPHMCNREIEDEDSAAKRFNLQDDWDDEMANDKSGYDDDEVKRRLAILQSSRF